MSPHPDQPSLRWPGPLSATLQRQLFALVEPYDPVMMNCRQMALPGVIYIHHGSLAVMFSNTEMDASLGVILGPGDWFGYQTLSLQPTQFFAFVEPLSPVDAYVLPQAKLQRLAENEPEVYKFLYFIGNRIHTSNLQLLLNSLHDLTSRLVYLLFELARSQPKVANAEWTLTISQQQLSFISGISRPRINQILKRLERDGEIRTQRGKIVIQDLQALQARINQVNLMFRDPRKLIPSTGH